MADGLPPPRDLEAQPRELLAELAAVVGEPEAARRCAGLLAGDDPAWQRLAPRLVKEVEEIMVAQDATHGAAEGTSPRA